ncbi:serine/threonine-protein kinase [Paenarthrobacter sp. NPDC058040]|uniref:serine/threonine-protein kinase n=1 Tax=unclassified Paenarthrobacter TaxID=2634190 RepID=UPI0036D970CF
MTSLVTPPGPAGAGTPPSNLHHEAMGSEAAARATGDSLLLGGRYRLGRWLGGGSEAQVHQAWDERTGTLLAAKIFRGAEPQDGSIFYSQPGTSTAFQRELDIHRRLRHRNIVRLRGSGGLSADGRVRDFVVMDLVDGRDLRSVLREAPAGPLLTVAWMSDVARALAYVHRRGIVHNDVKPGNILVAGAAGPGRAMLTDFGIAISPGHAPRSSSSGTPHYMSPEAVRGETPTPASDIYALGLVTLECLTGTKAFPGPPLESMVARTLSEPRVPGTVRRRWSMVLHAMTDPDPAGRPSASQIVGMFRRLRWRA